MGHLSCIGSSYMNVRHKSNLFPSWQMTKQSFKAPGPLVSLFWNCRLLKIAQRNLLDNCYSSHQFPLRTVCVRWRTGDLTPTDLYLILARFGSIDRLQTLRDKNAAVVFTDLTEACDVVTTKLIGQHDCKLYRCWMHRSMLSRRFEARGKKLLAINDDLLCPSK